MRERTPMSRALLERLPNLRHIVTSGMRNRSIDLAACRDLGIVVTGSPTLDHPTAELTMGLMLALARQIPREDRSLHAGGWATVVGQALRGSTLGILGLGRMGLQVARLARARSEEHTSELQSLMRISYAVFCLKKKKQTAQQ